VLVVAATGPLLSRLIGAAELDDADVSGSADAIGGDASAVIDLGLRHGGDPLLAQPPERLQKSDAEGVIGVVDLAAGGVVTDHTVLVFAVFGVPGPGGVAGFGEAGVESLTGLLLLLGRGVAERDAADGIQQQRRQGCAEGAGLGGEVPERVGLNGAVSVVVDREPQGSMTSPVWLGRSSSSSNSRSSRVRVCAAAITTSHICGDRMYRSASTR
jgi:hypothetical protein